MKVYILAIVLMLGILMFIAIDQQKEINFLQNTCLMKGDGL